MPLDERISDLLVQWDEARDQGHLLTPEELCRNCPELVTEVERHIRALRKLGSLLDTRDTDAETPPSAPPATPHASVSLELAVAKGESRYTPTKFHAAGGLGEVYKAHDEELRRDVALKQIKEELANNPACRREFLREAEITGKLEHPGVVPIYGLVHGPDGNPAYAMRFIEGESLRDAIRKFYEADRGKRDPGERTLALRQLLSRFIAVCNTVAFAHNRGVIHRDLKPANIMLGKYGETLVVDWGLARPFDRTETERASGEATLRHTPRDGDAPDATRLGEIKGTPSYMSPEQAEGMWESVGPASDIYSLGATLYELLTGAAPVRGRDSREIILKVRRGEVPPPRAIKPNVPKPLEAICLKAMALTPADRYLKADDLAKDLETWLADEPVVAYRESWLVRQRRFTRRHRLLVASLTAAVLVGFLFGGGGLGWWLWRTEAQQQLTRHDVEPMLAEAEEIMRRPERDWRDAENLLKQADSRMAGGGPSELRERLTVLQRDLEMVKQLEKARLQSTSVAQGKLDFRGGDRAYAAAFADFGLDLSGTSDRDVSEVIRTSLIVNRLIVALDYWGYCKDGTVPKSGMELRSLADSVDDDPWRRRLRLAVRTSNLVELEQLASEETSLDQPPTNLTLLAEALLGVHDSPAAESWLRKVNERYPQEISINFLLVRTAFQKVPPDPAEALRFCQATLAIQPHNPAALNNRGFTWNEKKDYDRAIRDFDEAIRLEPNFAAAYNNRGLSWKEKKDLDRAMRDYDEAIRLDPTLVPTFYNRGYIWLEKKEYERAIRDLDEAIRLDPSHALAFANRGNAWYMKKDFDRAMLDYDEAIRIDPNLALAFYNRGNAWLKKREYDRAIRDFDEAIRLGPTDAQPVINRGNAWAQKQDYDRAIRDYDEAVRLDPNNALAFRNRGLARYVKKEYDQAIRDLDEAIRLDPTRAESFDSRAGVWRAKQDYDRAIRDLNEAIRLDPTLATAFHNRGSIFAALNQFSQAEPDFRRTVELSPKYADAWHGLGVSLRQQGHFGEARNAFRTSLELMPEGSALHMRAVSDLKSCELLFALDKKLPDVLSGTERPANTIECFQLAQLCHLYRKQYVAGARFYSEAFEAQPEIVKDPKTGRRYDAACCALLAGCGKGKDADTLDDKDRPRLRKQALDWLQADLTLWAKQVETQKAENRAVVMQFLKHWQEDADLAGIRNEASVAKLPADEQEACKKLWADVEAVIKRTQEK
jgi:tetratricopeptide (TPR) repeat protein/tRNA A-37 threonylcarbamoyl transferase component Bud32